MRFSWPRTRRAKLCTSSAANYGASADETRRRKLLGSCLRPCRILPPVNNNLCAVTWPCDYVTTTMTSTALPLPWRRRKPGLIDSLRAVKVSPGPLPAGPAPVAVVVTSTVATATPLAGAPVVNAACRRPSPLRDVTLAMATDDAVRTAEAFSTTSTYWMPASRMPIKL